MSETIPQGQRQDAEEFPHDLPDLPDPWEWRTFNHSSLGKVNIYFGYDVYEPGGWLGEIDNYDMGDGVKWGLHIREIVEVPDNKHGCRPESNPETTEEFDALKDAIAETPDHIATYYGDEDE